MVFGFGGLQFGRQRGQGGQRNQGGQRRQGYSSFRRDFERGPYQCHSGSIHPSPFQNSRSYPGLRNLYGTGDGRRSGGGRLGAAGRSGQYQPSSGLGGGFSRLSNWGRSAGRGFDRMAVFASRPSQQSYGNPRPSQQSYGHTRPSRGSYGNPGSHGKFGDWGRSVPSAGLDGLYGTPKPSRQSYGNPRPSQQSYGNPRPSRQSYERTRPSAYGNTRPSYTPSQQLYKYESNPGPYERQASAHRSYLKPRTSQQPYYYERPKPSQQSYGNTRSSRQPYEFYGPNQQSYGNPGPSRQSSRNTRSSQQPYEFYGPNKQSYGNPRPSRQSYGNTRPSRQSSGNIRPVSRHSMGYYQDLMNSNRPDPPINSVREV